MCGIAGFIQRSAAPEVLRAMLGAIAHRGPDGDGVLVQQHGDWHVHLGHRRLSIIDLEGGAQPLGNEDGALSITYNGELYDYPALRARLEGRHQFRTKCDTEALVHHLEETGPAGLATLDGMFAFGLWNGREGSLLLARDRAGIKPLYIATLPDGGIAFASELSALLRHPAIPRKVSREGLLSYFFCDYTLPPTSMIEGVRKVIPGHFVRWADGAQSPQTAYWRIEDTAGSAPRPLPSDDALARELWSRMARAVDSQMVADVPVGVFLSGGLDSSSVAALAHTRTSERLRTFSIGFTEKSFDESDYARLVARHIGSEHIEEIVGEKDLLGSFETIIGSLDEPLADHSYLPTWMLSRLAARHVKVVLGGDGGDELWGGYPTYKAHQYARVYGRIPRVLRELAPGLAERLPVGVSYQSFDWKVRRFVGRWDDDRTTRHFRWLSSVDLPDLPRALPWSRGVLPAALARSYPELGGPLSTVLGIDFSTYMHASVLTKVDRASMAHGLEVRPPLLDNALIDFAFSLPDRVKLRGTHTKYLLKKAARGHVPGVIVDRPKRGFGIPLVSWLRGPLVPALDEALRGGVLWDAGLLDRATFQGYRDAHVAGRIDASKPLWALVVLSRWMERERIGA